MKIINAIFITAFTILSLQNAKAQWIELGSGINTLPRSVWSLAVPDENTIWAFTWDSQNIQVSTDFTKSTDGGQTWQPGKINLAPGLFVQNAFALDSMTLWITSYDFFTPGTGRIYKTEDGGQTWVHQNTGFPGFGEIPSVVHFFDENKGVCFGAGPYSFSNKQLNIYTTENGGDLWEKVPSANIPPQEFGEGMTIWINSGLYSAVGNTIWFPTTKGRVFRSTDMGVTWEVFTPGSLTPPHNPISIAMKDSLNGILVSSFPNEAMKTTDGGETWMPLVLPSNAFNTYQIRYIPGTSGAYIIHDGWDFNSTLAFITRDNGKNWEVIDTGESLSTSEFLSPTVGYGGGDLLAGGGGGVYKWGGDMLVSTQNNFYADETIILHPNPAFNAINLQFPGSLSPEQLTIVDCIGNVYFTQKIGKEGLPNSLSIKDLTSGVYFLQIKTDQKLITNMFVKI